MKVLQFSFMRFIMNSGNHMTRPVNIYTLSRIREEYAFHIIKRHQSHKANGAVTRYHEIESLRFLVNALIESGVQVGELDGFYFGYHIPRIGKEFDLLKFTERSCLNIELKSQAVSARQIEEQLQKNAYYLSHLGKETLLFTVETNTLKCWTLDNGCLKETSLDEIVCAVHACNTDHEAQIDDLFKASQYLVSPLFTPDRFIRNEYFLTPMQEHIKSSIMQDLSLPCHCIDGRSGTGKTLLLYDLAAALSRTDHVLLIHYGRLSHEHQMIMDAFDRLTICSSEEELPDLSQYRYILVDEAHRITPALFDQIIHAGGTSIFSCDPDQVLTAGEIKYDIISRIRAVPSVRIHVLSEHIRINKELHTFILCMKNLRHVGEFAMNFPNVDVNYADTTGEAQNMIEYYRERGYVFINCVRTDPEGPYAGFAQDFDPFHVIGQEFDRVVLLMDASFYYDEEGKLQGVPHPNPDYLYPNLFYQSITRVREQLSIVVVNAPELFSQIIRILNQELYGV